MAEWSGEMFNNRALFSDYYLTTPFREHAVWQEDPQPAYRRLREICRNAASRWTRCDVAQLRSGLLMPVFKTLGFHFDGRRTPRGVALDGYPLLGPGTEQPLALCLDYAWGRFLDGKDTAGLDPDTPQINPGAHVVSLLERGPAPWVIVTNGKLWRLYARRAHCSTCSRRP